MNKLIFMFGITFLMIGFIPIFLYINLLYFGYTFTEYVNHILRSKEIFSLLLGFILLNVYYFRKERSNWEKYMILY